MYQEYLEEKKIFWAEQYVEYLHSEEWEEKRVARLEIDEYKCQRCGSWKSLQVHHLTYKNVTIPTKYREWIKTRQLIIIYNEDIDEDLITFCSDCHQIEHEEKLLKKQVLTGLPEIPIVSKSEYEYTFYIK